MLGNIRKGMSEWKRMGLDLGPRGSTFWTNARMVWAQVPVDAQVVKDWVPFPLRLAKPATASVFIADYPQTSFGSVYHEAAILLDVSLFGIPMQYCPWMIVDDDSALILGREVLGYPKKMGEFRFEEKDGRFTGSVSRGGNEVFRIEAALTGEMLAAPPPGIGRWQANLRNMLGFVPGHLLVFRPRETVHSAERLRDVKVTLVSTPDDPIGIATGPAGEATIRSCDIGAVAWPPPLRVFPVSAFFQAGLMSLRVR